MQSLMKFMLHTIQTFFADAGIKLVFSGHEHCSDATTHTSPSGNTISDFATTSLTMYPLQYRYIQMSDDVIYYSTKTVDKIDTDTLREWIPDYSDAQIDAMNQDIDELKTNRDSLEKFAREQFGFSVPGEDVYIVEE